MQHIIFGTDSRGAGLEQYIRSSRYFTADTRTHVIVIPGGGIQRVTSSVARKAQEIRQSSSSSDVYITAAIAAGICDLTNKVNHTRGVELDYKNTDGKVSSVVSLIFATQRDLVSQGITCKFACIPPVSLSKFSQFTTSQGKLSESIFSEDEIRVKQTQLENDIKQINQEIISLNHELGKTTIRWDRDLLLASTQSRGQQKTRKIKVTKITYKNLYDGVHPNDFLKNKWYHFLCRSMAIEISMVELSEEEGEVENETWDFKRTT